VTFLYFWFSQAISLALAVILNPKDEVVLNSPNFISYYYLIQFLHSLVSESPRNEDLSPNFELLSKKLTSKTKLIIVNSPNNPTGYVFKKKEWEELADIVIENDLYILSDECYNKYIYDNSLQFFAFKIIMKINFKCNDASY